MQPRIKATTFILSALAALGLCAGQFDLFEEIPLGRLRHPVSMLSTRVSEVSEQVVGIFKAKQVPHVPGRVCAVVVTGRHVLLLDENGYVAAVDTVGISPRYPVLTGFHLTGEQRGSLVSSPETILGINVVRAFEDSGVLIDLLTEVDIENPSNPRAVLAGGMVVEFGARGYGMKVRRLGEILAQMAILGMSATRIDLRYRDQAVVEPGARNRIIDREV